MIKILNFQLIKNIFNMNKEYINVLIKMNNKNN